MLVGGLVGGGVSGGMHVALNVASGRRWHEGLGQAVAMGATTGALDAFTDFYGDKLVDRAMMPRPRAAGADDGVRPRGVGAEEDIYFQREHGEPDWAAACAPGADEPVGKRWSDLDAPKAGYKDDVGITKLGLKGRDDLGALKMQKGGDTVPRADQDRPGVRGALEVGPGPTDPAHIDMMQRIGGKTMLQALRKMYPEARLGAADVDPLVLNRIRNEYIETGQLPESTVLLKKSYTDAESIRAKGRWDLVVNVAPSPDLIAAAGGRTPEERAMNYVRSLMDLTEPGGRVYVAVDHSTLATYRQPLEKAFRDLAGASPVYHYGGGLGESALLPLQGVHSGWINQWFEGQTWVEYLAVRR